jgi:hypothetical protein
MAASPFRLQWLMLVATFGGTQKLLTNGAFPFWPSVVASADQLLTSVALRATVSHLPFLGPDQLLT